MHRNLKFTLVLLAWITGLYVVPLEAADSTEKPEEQKLISLAEAEPIIYYAFRRYDKFYGDENTAHGGLLERSSLLGGSGGARDYLVDHGLYLDASITRAIPGARIAKQSSLRSRQGGLGRNCGYQCFRE